MEVFDYQTDLIFVKEMLLPYLSSVFFNLLERQGNSKNYLSPHKVQEYMCLPDILG
jgi:hypothetical protein